MRTYSFERAENFIWANARLLERRIFEALFLSGPREMVFTALKAYQNLDGGFGNALEPDKRDPHSQPVDFERALQMLDLVDGLTDPAVHRDLLLPACDWLVTVTTPEGGVPFAMPSTRQYPHAPWWGVDDNPPASLNPTADLVGLLLKAGVRHPWIDRASAFCWKAIEATETEQYHDLMPIISFLENAPDRARAEQALARVVERIRKPGVVAYDVDAQGYVKKPLDWAPTSTSYLRRLFDDATVSTHLDALAARQSEDGSWPITWDPISPAVGLEWRGWTTIDALHTLRSYETEK